MGAGEESLRRKLETNKLSSLQTLRNEARIADAILLIPVYYLFLLLNSPYGRGLIGIESKEKLCLLMRNFERKSSKHQVVVIFS